MARKEVSDLTSSVPATLGDSALTHQAVEQNASSSTLLLRLSAYCFNGGDGHLHSKFYHIHCKDQNESNHLWKVFQLQHSLLG